MNKGPSKFIKWMQNSDGWLKLGFDTMLQADAFLHSQTGNLEWRQQWRLRYHEDGVIAETNSPHIALHL